MANAAVGVPGKQEATWLKSRAPLAITSAVASKTRPTPGSVATANWRWAESFRGKTVHDGGAGMEESTVRYLERGRKLPSSAWLEFLSIENTILTYNCSTWNIPHTL